ncbi:type II/IV secretion system protein [Paenalkalicoccus suaedae]|uniref:Type II/IV secretion system protein n=1 Tax=Paenalkalicoccus suaedae TaxID=2592382 RepID=A0A859FCY7_9BACI|nr:competence type IV pilus ATPase ComGA [Paenalkalicoccus suaedae]QKS70927.1 type II/IV secretion system protein [Paenalkalicoccus suaedae]
MDIVAKTNQLLHSAVEVRASDIHIVPDDKRIVVKFRIDGTMMEAMRLPLFTGRKLISHLKFVSGMEVGERRRPQNKRLDMTIANQKISIRVSSFPSTHMETLVLRLFPEKQSEEIRKLALFPAQAAHLQKLIHSPHGLILICGPTGAGKTTTLYSLLHDRKQSNENIITLEDPVESPQQGFLQMEINERAGVTYTTGLKSLLRHDPDLIMIGEIRDRETAEIAISAALTGHLVVSSLHSATAGGAFKRMLDLGVDLSDLQEVLRGVVAQKLVELVCPYCKTTCSLHCKKQRKKRRAALYEIVMEEELSRAFHSIENNRSYHADISLRDLYRKGVALGFIPIIKEYEYAGALLDETRISIG